MMQIAQQVDAALTLVGQYTTSFFKAATMESEPMANGFLHALGQMEAASHAHVQRTHQTSCLNKRKLVLNHIYVGHNVHSELTMVGSASDIAMLIAQPLIQAKPVLQIKNVKTIARVLAPLMSPNSQHSARAKGFTQLNQGASGSGHSHDCREPPTYTDRNFLLRSTSFLYLGASLQKSFGV